MAFIPTYIANKLNPSQVTYDTPLLEPILKVTYGVIVYQEQVMQIFQDLAGFSLGQADLVRRAMGKKNKAELMAQKDKFIYGNIKDGGNIEGAVSRGIPKDIAAKIFSDMESFASYAFNKAHAACYAVLAYRTAYLKRFYPKEFLAAILNNRIDKIDEVAKYIVYLKEKNIVVLPADINRSKVYFSVQGNGVRIGLCALRGVGLSAMTAVIAERERGGDYKDFSDFAFRCGNVVNKRMVEGLICAGAFDCFGKNRAQMLSVYESVLDRANKIAKQKQGSQMSLFGDILEEKPPEIIYPDIPELEMSEKLAKEKAVLGVYVSGHPFEKYVAEYADCNFNCLKLQSYDEDEEGNRTYTELTDGETVTMGGIIGSFRRINTRTGAPMAFISVEDLYGNIECVAFPSTYERIRSAVATDKIVRVTGKLQISEGKAPVILVDKMVEHGANGQTENVSAEAERPVKRENVLWLNASALTEEDFNELVALVGNYDGGNVTVKIKRGSKIYKMNGVNDCRGLRDELALYLQQSDIVTA